MRRALHVFGQLGLGLLGERGHGHAEAVTGI
jgi:hypothetical protein